MTEHPTDAPILTDKMLIELADNDPSNVLAQALARRLEAAKPSTPIDDEGLERLVEICAGIADSHDMRGDTGKAIRKLALKTYKRGSAPNVS